MRKKERKNEVESSLKLTPPSDDEARKFSILFHASDIVFFRLRPSFFSTPPPSPEVENIADFPGEGRCEKREISKCPSIIKVYRFAGRLSYANFAGGHPLG